MATAYTVLYNKKLFPGAIPEGTAQPIATAVQEKYTLMDAGTSPVVTTGPIATYTAVEVEANDEEAAAEYCRVFLGATAQEGELRIATTANLKSISSK